CGQGIGAVKSVPTTAQFVDNLMAGYKEAKAALGAT
ncbi:MAG: nitronate monooxygenase, partial [Alphaproteobacteria bacterium]|nr:nitronate monooxygenase [Alphaproteobacteria bacterium]